MLGAAKIATFYDPLGFIRKVPDSCVLYYPGIVGGGTTILDRSGRNNYGNLTNVTWSRLSSGVFIPTFPGNAYITDTSDSALDFTSGDFSFLFWLKHDLVAACMPFARYSHNVAGYRTELATNGTLTFRTAQLAANQVTTSSAGAISANTLTFIVVTRSGTAVKIYANGNDVTSGAGTHVNPATLATFLILGASTVMAGYITGQIGIFTALSRMLSAPEVAYYYNAQRKVIGV